MGRHIAPLLHAACLTENQQIPNIYPVVIGLTRPGHKPMICHTGCEHANHYTIDSAKFSVP